MRNADRQELLALARAEQAIIDRYTWQELALTNRLGLAVKVYRDGFQKPPKLGACMDTVLEYRDYWYAQAPSKAQQDACRIADGMVHRGEQPDKNTALSVLSQFYEQEYGRTAAG